MEDSSAKLSDTIAAVATARGRGAIGIVRVSGPRAADVAAGILGTLPEPRAAHYGRFVDARGRTIDRGIALYFPAPDSYTGEHVLELHSHGGAIVLDMLMERVIELGARAAKPGEFTERAFLNGKLDLAQAEAVADLIDASSRAAARNASASLQGEFSQRLTFLADALLALRADIEAGLDFPDEPVDQQNLRRLSAALTELRRQLADIRRSAGQGALVRDGLTVAIVGRPNVGKSSLFNALVRRDRAIVTDMPGTTRDTVAETIDLAGLPVHLIDTAGLRETADRVEREGVERARTAVATADICLLVCEAADQLGEQEIGVLEHEQTSIVVCNKIDLCNLPARRGEMAGQRAVWLSAKSGTGLDLLEQTFGALAGAAANTETGFSARRRHLDALERIDRELGAAAQVVKSTAAPELLAEHLRCAQLGLDEITGKVTSDDVLGEIFSRFCIGK
jgi:tRNA modification GTPase